MDNEEQVQEIFPLSLELDTGTKLFPNIEAYKEWVKEQKEFFSWVENSSKSNQQTQFVWNEISKWIDSIETLATRYQSLKNHPDRLMTLVESITTTLSQQRSSGTFFTSESPEAIFAKNISKDRDIITGTYVLANLMEIGTTPNQPKPQFAAFLAFKYRVGDESTLESSLNSFEQTRNDWQGLYEDARKDIVQNAKEIREELDEFKEIISTTEAAIKEVQKQQEDHFSGFIDGSKANLEDITNTYDNKLALQASVQYWVDKRSFHQSMLWKIGVATLLLAILTGAGFVTAAFKLLDVSIKEVELWRLGVMLAISTFGIWMTRLGGKIFVSNLHLRTDSDERVTMIQTYLALLREGAGPKDDERQLILQTLFRPSTTGIIKDDGPSAFHEQISAALSRR